MNRKKSIIILFFILSAEIIGAGEQGSEQKIDSIQILRQRIDSIEVDIANIKMNLLDQSPYATGDMLQWGKGFFHEINVHFLSQIYLGLNLGYMDYLTMPWSEKNPYLGKLRRQRFGGSWGLFFLNQRGHDLVTNQGHDTVAKKSQNNSGYYWIGHNVKIYFSSPVNAFLSFSMYYEALFTESTNYSSNASVQQQFRDPPDNHRIGLLLELWTTKKSSFLFGVIITSFPRYDIGSLLEGKPGRHNKATSIEMNLGTRFFF